MTQKIKGYNPKSPGKLGRHNTKTKSHIYKSKKDYNRNKEKQKIKKEISKYYRVINL
ncbi:MAG: hypothetical protein ACOCP8_04075 [archaeon]